MKSILNGSGFLLGSGLVLFILLGVAGFVSFGEAGTLFNQFLLFALIMVSIGATYGLLAVIVSRIRRG